MYAISNTGVELVRRTRPCGTTSEYFSTTKVLLQGIVQIGALGGNFVHGLLGVGLLNEHGYGFHRRMIRA